MSGDDLFDLDHRQILAVAVLAPRILPAALLENDGVLVNCVAPAVIKTELFSQMTEQHIQYMLSKIPMNRFGEVEEVAELVSWLASPLCTFSTASVFDLSGGRATY
jgi:3-oxoacyl-[acyl-carrier protein] reductase